MVTWVVYKFKLNSPVRIKFLQNIKIDLLLIILLLILKVLWNINYLVQYLKKRYQ